MSSSLFLRHNLLLHGKRRNGHKMCILTEIAAVSFALDIKSPAAVLHVQVLKLLRLFNCCNALWTTHVYVNVVADCILLHAILVRAAYGSSLQSISRISSIVSLASEKFGRTPIRVAKRMRQCSKSLIRLTGMAAPHCSRRRQPACTSSDPHGMHTQELAMAGDE